MLTGVFQAILMGGIAVISFFVIKPKERKFNFKDGLFLFFFIIVGFLKGIWLFTPLAFHNELVFWIVISIIVGGWRALIGLGGFYQGLTKRVIVLFLVIIIGVIIWSFSSPMLKSDEIAQQIKPKEVSESFIKKVDTAKIRLVPKETAVTMAKTTISKYKYDGFVLGSVLKVNTQATTVQKVNDKLYWIIPLQYNGFFEQFNLGNIPAYIAVSAYDPNVDPILIKNSPKTGEKTSLEYSLGGYFNRNAIRKLWSDDISTILRDFSFEVDNDWNPYVVASIMEPKVAGGTLKVVGVKVLDLTSGKIESYDLKNIPQWIDRVVPLNNALKFTNNYGTLRNGFLNSIFGKKGVFKPTSYQGSSDMFFVEVDGQAYWFTGLTSSSKTDNSLVGSMLINTRNYKSYQINTSGPDENGIVQSVSSLLGANGQVWSPQQPIPYNIFGQPTWVVPLNHRKTHYWQGVALVNMANVNLKVYGSSLKKALRKYNKSLRKGNAVDTNISERVFEGEVTVTNFVTVNDSLIVYFSLKGIPKVFQASAEATPEFLVLKEGRHLKIEAADTGEKLLSVTKLLNPWLKGQSEREVKEIKPQNEVKSSQ